MTFKFKEFKNLTTSELYEILKARAKIFMMEQNIHYLDLDDIDYNSLHFFIIDDNKIVAYLRAFTNEDNDIQIGRVLTLEHKKGLGKKLLKKSLEVIKEKYDGSKIVMNAQKQAEGFYLKFGFIPVSDIFLEEGIEHIKMELDIK
ncbi:MAG: GNAT family N-acetyltransferase [Ruminococcus sp.]|nr:GNAT family N-acetyltransferase [Ruminococcus sp.]